jgi:hypothetical protein
VSRWAEWLNHNENVQWIANRVPAVLKTGDPGLIMCGHMHYEKGEQGWKPQPRSDRF